MSEPVMFEKEMLSENGLSVGGGEEETEERSVAASEAPAGSGEDDVISRLREECLRMKTMAEKAECERDAVREALRSLTEEADSLRKKLTDWEKHENDRRKEDALGRYFRDAGLSSEAEGIARRGMKEEIEALTLDENGEISEYSRTTLDALLAGPFQALSRLGALSGEVTGTSVPRPMTNTGWSGRLREEILSIRDGGERRRAILENPGVFGLE